MKSVRAMRFQLFSKGKFPDSFTSSNPWTYNKLSL
jgi:hypothetical protein